MNPNNPNDPLDFEEDDLLTAEDRLADGDDDREPQGVSLAEIWRNNPSLKIFAVVLVVGIFLIVFLVFGGDEEANPSAVGGRNAVNQPPGTAQLPPAYEEAVRVASEQRATNAEMTGGSALPTPIGTAERIEAPPTVENVDPLAEWRRAAEQRATQRREVDQVTLPAPEPEPPAVQVAQTQPVQVAQAPVQAGPPPLPTGPNPQDVTNMAQRLSDHMRTILETQIPQASTLMGLNIPTGYEVTREMQAQQLAQQQQQAVQQAIAQQQATPKVIIAAGTIAYAQTLIEANSDVQGPVLAELASGPLSGARLIGNFQLADDYLTLRFNRAIYKGKEYQIEAWALDPATTLPAMATDVDRHYFSRILIPAAARFLQGYAQAVSQRGSTIIVNNGSTVATTDGLDGRQAAVYGVSEAVSQAAQIVQQDANRTPITVKVAAGTRMGLLFTTALTDTSANPALIGTSAYGTQAINGPITAASAPVPLNNPNAIQTANPGSLQQPRQIGIAQTGNPAIMNSGSNVIVPGAGP